MYASSIVTYPLHDSVVSFVVVHFPEAFWSASVCGLTCFSWHLYTDNDSGIRKINSLPLYLEHNTAFYSTLFLQWLYQLRNLTLFLFSLHFWDNFPLWDSYWCREAGKLCRDKECRVVIKHPGSYLNPEWCGLTACPPSDHPSTKLVISTTHLGSLGVVRVPAQNVFMACGVRTLDISCHCLVYQLCTSLSWCNRREHLMSACYIMNIEDQTKVGPHNYRRQHTSPSKRKDLVTGDLYHTPIEWVVHTHTPSVHLGHIGVSDPSLILPLVSQVQTPPFISPSQRQRDSVLVCLQSIDLFLWVIKISLTALLVLGVQAPQCLQKKFRFQMLWSVID